MPLALVVVARARRLAAVGSSSTWLTLTVAGLAMGMIIFIAASGLTLVFGLMDVLELRPQPLHRARRLRRDQRLRRPGRLGGGAEHAAATSPRSLVAMLAAMLLAGAIGLGFERVIVRPVYGQHLKQILVTIGGAIIGEELIKVVWGPAQIPLPPPEALRGSILHRRRDGREAPPGRRSRSASSCSRRCSGRSTAPRSAC